MLKATTKGNYEPFSISKKVKLAKDTPNEIVLSFTRTYFKSTYDIAKKIVPEIDFISSKNTHFEIELRNEYS